MKDIILELKEGVNEIPIWEIQDCKVRLKELPNECTIDLMYPDGDGFELWLSPLVCSIKKLDDLYFTFNDCIHIHGSKEVAEFVLNDRIKYIGDIERYDILGNKCSVIVKIPSDTCMYELEEKCKHMINRIVSDIGFREDKKLSFEKKEDVKNKLPVYKRALNKVKMEIENFKEETYENKNKIIDILGRVKDIDSIEEKVYRKDISSYEIFDKFDDIAGIRVVCEYLDDVYELLEYINTHPEFNILKIEDKIKEPIKTGYRGIHIILSTNVYYKQTLYKGIKIEIQVRTSFQNTWSMKTHKLTYKNEDNIPKEMLETMKELSDVLHSADEKVQLIKKKIDKLQ